MKCPLREVRPSWKEIFWSFLTAHGTATAPKRRDATKPVCPGFIAFFPKIRASGRAISPEWVPVLWKGPQPSTTSPPTIRPSDGEELRKIRDFLFENGLLTEKPGVETLLEK